MDGKVQGIVVEIGGDTSGLQAALLGVYNKVKEIEAALGMLSGLGDAGFQWGADMISGMVRLGMRCPVWQIPFVPFYISLCRMKDR